MFLCLCRAVRASEVTRVIDAGARTVQQVAACTGAGTCCGMCVDDVRQKLREARLRELPPADHSLAAK